jgi:hypothetical protein
MLVFGDAGEGRVGVAIIEDGGSLIIALGMEFLEIERAIIEPAEAVVEKKSKKLKGKKTNK